jgi:hypothetical protein
MHFTKDRRWFRRNSGASGWESHPPKRCSSEKFSLHQKRREKYIGNQIVDGLGIPAAFKNLAL